MTTLHLADAPKFASMHAYNCARCDHEELLHPVFLSDGNAYGTGCAAIKLGLVPETATKGEARKALKVAQDERTAAEAKARREAADAEAAPWFAFCAQFGGVAEANRHFGGFLEARKAFADAA